MRNNVYLHYVFFCNKFQRIIKSLDIKDKIDGIHKIFDYIAYNTSYENGGVAKTNIENQNLYGAVLKQRAVCEGNSKYLMQLLSLIDVYSIIVQNGVNKNEDGHVWNQILVNGNWYNADVTVASYNIKNNQTSNTCLISDSGLFYKTNTAISYICSENYETDFEIK